MPEKNPKQSVKSEKQLDHNSKDNQSSWNCRLKNANEYEKKHTEDIANSLEEEFDSCDKTLQSAPTFINNLFEEIRKL